MARYLVISDRYPDDLSHGRHLRVHHLCRELGRKHECFLVDFQGAGEDAPPGIFAGRLSLPDRPAREQRSLRRLFRVSNARYLEMSAPDWLHDATTAGQQIIERWGCRAVVSFAPPIAEVAAGLRAPRVLDWPDSSTLIWRRRLAAHGSELGLRRRWVEGLQAHRQRGRESALVKCFDLTITIAEPDRDVLLEVGGVAADRVRVVPNGVSEQALRTSPQPGMRENSVVFWGNLDFPPNASAVRWFHRQVWRPLLAGSGITWHIVGANAAPDIVAMGNEPGICVHGYVAELFTLARGQGVMINPMVEGSGLRNKVLEAFALGLPVVSTTLGADAFGIEDGRHCCIADAPTEFAFAVRDLLEQPARAQRIAINARELVHRRFTWPAAGKALVEALEYAYSDSSRARAA